MPSRSNRPDFGGVTMNAVCIKCWNPDALVKLHMDGSGEFECDECEETFTCADVRKTMEAMQTAWAKLVGWAESYPKE
jgi:hypothetical protein